MPTFKKPTVRRTKRTDQIIALRQRYSGSVHDSPAMYNKAYPDVLRSMADAIEKVKDAWVDPEVIVWMHFSGEISAQVMLSPQE